MDMRARERMVRGQVRCWSVLDERVLAVFSDLPREDFVPEQYRALAYADLALPLPGGQEMMTPSVEGRILQALDPASTDSVLEIGTGSGWFAACLARLAGEVTSLEISPELHAEASRRLDGVDNATALCADAFDWEPGSGFDAVVLTGSLPAYDDRFESWLKPGGRLFCIVGSPPIMEALLITPGAPSPGESLFETVTTPLANAPQPDPFRF
ncbi:MAG: protein-L-isoaspartate O-methyltransferase [Gammaproteobacteria bacterium]|nr:protein-L-isoaspartate O-methyltransferase [Gammaproteobacteria bacterium]